jgi:hypothetical protein
VICYKQPDGTKLVNTSFTYLGSYADSRMACQLSWQQRTREMEDMRSASRYSYLISRS